MIKNATALLLLLIIISCKSHEPIDINTIKNCYQDAEYNRLKLNSDDSTKHKYCLKISRDFGSLYYVSANLNSLGAIEHLKVNYNKALEYYEESLEVAEENGMRLQKTILFNNMGEICRNQKYYDKSANYFEKAIYLSLEIKSYDRINKILGNFTFLSDRTDYKRMCKVIDNISTHSEAYNIIDEKYKEKCKQVNK